MQGAPIVVKANGLAAGKGVVVAFSLQEAFDAVDSMLLDKSFGDAGTPCDTGAISVDIQNRGLALFTEYS